ncbi:MAG: NAD-dependent succinate-semialdehyde dehydrogenase [Microbacteriaceae bacterium]|nr:NAD-dependent succinate-semialdehyde dehydrogenase [Microbacteriaceae bacterium]
MSKYAVTNPATGEVVKTYDEATDAQIEAALADAHDTYKNWGRTTTVAERAALLQRVADLHMERQDELAAIFHREMGKPLEQCKLEVEFSAGIIEAFAKGAEEWLADDELKVEDGLKTIIKHHPIGAILGIMPWNYPFYQIARFAAPVLAVGNTTIVKHANQCPETALALEGLFREAGFPEGAYINVFASHDQISTIIADDRIAAVSLTGSERAGAIVAEQAGRALKKCVLELGGSDVFIVLDVKDIDAAVEYAVGGRMENTGQACNGSKRIVVLDSVYDEFSKKFCDAIAAQNPDNGDYGPLSSDDATKTLSAQVQKALDQGAKLIVGDNNPDGNWYTPSVLTDVTPEMDVYREELFGPVAQLYKVSSDQEAIDLCNSSPYGLGSVVMCDDVERAERVGDALEVGMVFINASGLEGTDVPFGGVKKSGYGREIGKYGIHEFTNKKLYRYAG